MRILIQIGFVVAAWHSTNRTLRAIYTHARAYWISNSRFVVLFAWRFARVRNMNIKRMQRIRWRRRKKRKKNCVQSINFMRRRIYFIICKQLAECILVYLVNCVYRFVRFVFTFGFPLGVTVFRYIFFFVAVLPLTVPPPPPSTVATTAAIWNAMREIRVNRWRKKTGWRKWWANIIHSHIFFVISISKCADRAKIKMTIGHFQFAFV